VGTERIVPVSLADADGRPLHSLEAPGVVPFLSYAPHSFFGRCLSFEDGLLKPFQLQTVYENAMAEGLRAMLLAGYGMAWLPISSIAGDLEAGRVVRAGDEALDLVVEIRLYRSLRNRRAKVEQVWAAVDEFAAARPQRA
jgi:DNA-binding transcriptional LysR family regulator